MLAKLEGHSYNVIIANFWPHLRAILLNFSHFNTLCQKLQRALYLVTDRTFGSAELFGRTSTAFSPNDRTFFCRTHNFFLYYILGFSKWLRSLRYFKVGLCLKTNPKYESKKKLFCGDNFRQEYCLKTQLLKLFC